MNKVNFNMFAVNKVHAETFAGCRVGSKADFVCHDGSKCVEKRQRCDTVIDCPDGSDERRCGIHHIVTTGTRYGEVYGKCELLPIVQLLDLHYCQLLKKKILKHWVCVNCMRRFFPD